MGNLKVTRMPCHLCQAPVVQLPLFNGRRRTFNAVEVRPEGEPVGVAAEHWYPMRGKGAVPGDMIEDDLTDRPYLTLHRCVPVQDLARHELIEIRHTQGTVKVEDLSLDQMHEYTYRWPSSWAHIIGEVQSVALCGARMPGRRTNPRERDRLRGMPVCPDCMQRLELSKESRGRAILQAVRDKARAEVEAGALRVDPASMGKFLRRRHTADAPVHLPTCPYVRSKVFVPSEWEGFETFPRMSLACELCRPVASLDERLAMALNQVEVAARVHEEQDKVLTDAEVAARRELEAAFARLGTYVYRPAGAGKPATKVHHCRCSNLLAKSSPEGFVGTHTLPEGISRHYCVDYSNWEN